MGFWIFILLLSTSVFSSDLDKYGPDSLQNLKKGSVFYVDPEGDIPGQIYLEPGKNWKNCNQTNKCSAVALARENDALRYTGRSKMIMQVPPGGTELEPVVYVEVEYDITTKWGRYTSDKAGKPGRPGWIVADRLHTEKLKPIYRTHLDSSITKPDCERGCKDPAKEFKRLLQETEVKYSKNLDAIVASLEGKIGHCALPMKDGKPALPTFNKRVMYDEHVLPKLQQQDWSSVKIKNEQQKQATAEDMITIDAVARTLYAEMGICHRYGIEYYMAVAATLKNRALYYQTMEDVGRKDLQGRLFVKECHYPEKSPLAKVATEPTQYATWKHKAEGANKDFAFQVEELRQNSKNKEHFKKQKRILANKKTNAEEALCPPSNLNSTFFEGRKPSKEENQRWKDAVKIASEMVLFPNSFDQKTKDVSHYSYTSNGGYIKGVPIANPQPAVAGRKLGAKNCITFRDLKPKYAFGAPDAYDQKIIKKNQGVRCN